MVCKSCGAFLSDDLTECPACGALLSEEPETASDNEEGLIEELDQDSVIEDSEEEYIPSSSDGCSAPKKSNSNKKLIILCSVLAGLLIIAIAACVALSIDGVSDKITGFFSDVFNKKENEPYNPEAVIAEFGEHKLTNEQFTYYYYSDYYYMIDMMTAYGVALFDTTKPLSGQEYEDGKTWQDYFTESALNSWQSTMALCDIAEQAKYVLPDEIRKQLDSLSTDLSQTAVSSGLESGEEYLKTLFGDYATIDGYKEYMEASQYSGNYYYQEFNKRYDEYLYDLEGLESFNVNVRHILFMPTDDSSDASWADAEKKANEIYEQWKSGVATEESFGALATEHTEDTGSASVGGLYEDVYEGYMVEEFDAWCFDKSRKTGDHGIVKTEYGYHIMYFVAHVNPNAYTTAQTEVDAIITAGMAEHKLIKNLKELTIKPSKTQ